MKSLISIVIAFLLLTMVSGCKELDKLAELDEIERMLEKMQSLSIKDSLRIDSALSYTDLTDSVIYVTVAFDSLQKNSMQTIIKKVKLEGHDYWTIVGVGENMGGTGITHSESCWCRRFKSCGIK